MTAAQFGAIFLALVLVASLFASLGLAVSAFARSFKEAQSVASGPLMFVAFPLCSLAMPQTATLHRAFVFVPLTNVALLVEDMLRGQAQALDVVFVIAEMAVLADVALAWTILSSDAKT
jgi:ABC-type Na+ efflux pump permease subunit